ncbi:MAG: hypothetical protein IPL77_12625 [Flavobacteriales bacterium]|nr:hypothetical protein [Flavobacteriales bacterium]
MVVSFVALGAFAGLQAFEIPTGASAFLLFTMLLMVLSALYSWLKGWTLSVVIGLVVGLNLLSYRTESFLYDNQAYGLDYQAPPARYDRPALAALAYDTVRAALDKQAMEGVLDRWRSHNENATGTAFPAW